MNRTRRIEMVCILLLVRSRVFLLLPNYSIFLLLPLGAGHICGVCVYVTVLVTISLTWRTLDLVAFGDLTSK